MKRLCRKGSVTFPATQANNIFHDRVLLIGRALAPGSPCHLFSRSAGSIWLPRRHRARPSAALDDAHHAARTPPARQYPPFKGCEDAGMTPWIRTIRHEELPREQMLEAKGGKTISVCVPARNEERTVAAVVRAIIDPHSLERGGTGLVDEVLVIDDGSEDDTSGAAERAGARVVSMSPGVGKGNAMRAGLEESTGDIVV